MKCTKCGTEYETKFCPNCGMTTEEQLPKPNILPNNAPKKKTGCLKIGLIVIGVIFLLAIIGSIFGNKSTNNGSSSVASKQSETISNSKPTENAPESKPTETIKTEFGINEPATYKNTKLTVTNVEKSAGGDFDKPKDGMEYVIVTVEYENIGDDRISYNPFDFEMKNSQGQINESTFSTINSDTALSSGDLASGGKVSGTIAFQEPVGDTELVLTYTGSILSNNEKITFKLQ